VGALSCDTRTQRSRDADVGHVLPTPHHFAGASFVVGEHGYYAMVGRGGALWVGSVTSFIPREVHNNKYKCDMKVAWLDQDPVLALHGV
jgi:hypothetical protein